MTWYAFLKALTGFLVRSIVHVEVEGRENLPRRGPFLLVANHQSVLDPIVVQSSIPRDDIYTLTKSTQFAGPFFRWVLPRIHAIPVRRYRVDPQAVRVLLRHLDAGRAGCLYPEGERTWDGAVQPLRRGAVRVILKVGVPVVPCGVSGTFDVWPRWSRRLRSHDVRVRFGAPLEFGRHDDREEREARLEETASIVRARLAELSGAPLARSAGDAAGAPADAAPARAGVGPTKQEASSDPAGSSP